MVCFACITDPSWDICMSSIPHTIINLIDNAVYCFCIRWLEICLHKLYPKLRIAEQTTMIRLSYTSWWILELNCNSYTYCMSSLTTLLTGCIGMLHYVCNENRYMVHQVITVCTITFWAWTMIFLFMTLLELYIKSWVNRSNPFDDIDLYTGFCYRLQMCSMLFVFLLYR